MNEKRTWESDVSDALDRRVRDLHDAPLSLEQVATRARRIRRRRRTAVAGGILAVAAVVTPVAVVTAGGGGQPDGVPPAAPPSQTVTDPVPPPAEPAGPLPPMIGRLEGSTFVRGDGVEFELPGSGYTRADQLGAEIVASRSDDEGDVVIEVLEAPADGGEAVVTDTLPATGPYVTAPDGLAIAWMTPEGELMTKWDRDQVSFGTELPESAYPAAITGGPNCYDVEVEGGNGCTVFLNRGDGSGPPILVSSHGIQDVAVPGAQAIRDVDASGLASVQLSSTDDGSCGGLYDSGTSTLLFETCDHTVGGISPSGAHVLAGPAYLDGLGDAFVAILDRQGTEVARWEEGGTVVSRTWEDPGHVVFTVFEDGRWTVWRLGTDGESERLTDPVPGSDAEPPVQFFE